MSFFRHASPTVRLGVVTATAGTVAAGSYYLTRPRHPQWRRAEPQRDAQGRVITPSFPTIPSRTEQLARLRHQAAGAAADDDAEYDLLVIGGGATGTGIALDAATRGLKVALVERGDFASGTSSKSTKLVHGGVRYLEKAFWNLDYAQFELVVEALSERKTFLNGAPHLSGSVPILIPLYSWWQAPYFWAGTKAYDLLAGSEGLARSYILSRRQAVGAFPLLRRDGLLGGLVFYDGQHNDSRMNVTIALTAALYGATLANYVEVTALVKDAAGRVCGVRARDALPGARDTDEFVVRAKGVVNATGAFADAIEKMADPAKPDIVCPSSGVHLSLPGTLSPQHMGLLDANTSDGRVIYFLPWQGKMIAGTTDTPCRAERDVVAQEHDIAFILDEVRKNLAPDAPVTRAAVTAAWSGIRPLVRDPHSTNTESLVRNHLVTVDASGLLTCAGGKWTTYRQMAEDAVDEAVRVFGLQPTQPPPAVNVSGVPDDGRAVPDITPDARGACATKHLRMVGAHGYSQALPAELAAQYGFDAETAAALAANYGDRAWQVAALTDTNVAKLSPAFPVLESEVRHAVRHEYAQTAADFVSRRTRMSFLDVQAALEALPRVVDLMAEELQWDGARAAQEWADTVRHLVSMGLPATLASVSRQEVLAGQHKAAIEAGKHPHQAAVAAAATDDAPSSSASSSAPKTAGFGGAGVEAHVTA